MGLLSRLVVKCVRSTTSLAVTMDLALGQVILVLVVSCLVGGGSSETLKVSSTGAAATKQGDKMGDYMLTSRTQNGHPVYKKTSGVRNFLYVSSNGFWTIGRTEGSTTSGIYNPQFATPSSKPPTSGWLYSDLPNGWRADDTLKVERKTASPAGVAAVDQSVLLRRQLLERQALERQLAAQTAPRTLPSTAAVVPATRAAQSTAAATAPAAGCPLRIQVLITSNSSLPTNTDSGQAANRYAGTGNNGQISVPTQDYRGTYRRNDFLSAEGYPTYTNIANAAMTISRVTTVTGTQWQMSGGCRQRHPGDNASNGSSHRHHRHCSMFYSKSTSHCRSCSSCNSCSSNKFCNCKTSKSSSSAEGALQLGWTPSDSQQQRCLSTSVRLVV